MNYQELIISLTLFIIALLLIAWWLVSKCKVLEKELNKEKASNKFVVPVAKVKAQFSEEDMKMSGWIGLAVASLITISRDKKFEAELEAEDQEE